MMVRDGIPYVIVPLVLAVLPLAAAFWGFGTLAKRAEERRVDTRLEAELRAVFASYDHRIGQVEARAHRLAGRPLSTGP